MTTHHLQSLAIQSNVITVSARNRRRHLHLLRIGLAPLAQVLLRPPALVQFLPQQPLRLLLVGFPLRLAAMMFPQAPASRSWRTPLPKVCSKRRRSSSSLKNRLAPVARFMT